MKKWSGFSLTPHLRICDGDEKEEQEFEVRNEGSNGSLFSTDPLSYHPPAWRYDSNLDYHHEEEQGPKLEDFLSNSHQTECPINHNQTNVNCTVVRPQYPNPSNDYGAFERVGLVSVFKSWLREYTPTFPISSTGEGGTSNTNHFSSEETDYNTKGSILSLAMSHDACSDLINKSNVSMWVEEEPVKVDDKRKRSTSKSQAKESVKKSVDSFGQRTSKYRGVTRHRWTRRYEAHLWDNTCKKEGQTRKGKQVYLGGYGDEEKAARAYDLAALKYWGPTTHLNSPLSNYEKEMEELKNMNRQEFVAMLRRNSSGFSRGASVYRGVTRHHQQGRWQARIGRVAGNKDLYLGTFSTQEEAAEAYDIAAIKFRGLNAITNFDISRYDVNKICSNSAFLNTKPSPTAQP